MNAEQILVDWLKTHGYDGLYSDNCGCTVDCICPCVGNGLLKCKPGYAKQTCSKDLPCYAECDYDTDGSPCHCIGPKKPDEKKL
jgi:hypothetical protein